jgi:Uma2 family endonuclease
MLVGEKQITFEEYMAMPIGAPYQLISGCLVAWPSRTPAHQIALGNTFTAISNYAHKVQNEGMFLIGPIEVILDKQNSFQPDFVYIAKERLEIVKDYIYGPPDLVVEVLWEKNAYYDLRPKMDTYEKYGVKEFIIIDPIAEDGDLYALKDGHYILQQKAQKNETLNSILLPGLSIELLKVFK